jgi:hypothetical protein
MGVRMFKTNDGVLFPVPTDEQMRRSTKFHNQFTKSQNDPITIDIGSMEYRHLLAYLKSGSLTFDPHLSNSQNQKILDAFELYQIDVGSKWRLQFEFQAEQKAFERVADECIATLWRYLKNDVVNSREFKFSATNLSAIQFQSTLIQTQLPYDPNRTRRMMECVSGLIESKYGSSFTVTLDRDRTQFILRFK